MRTKIIHQIWFDLGNGNKIPDKYKTYQESWIRHHPDWKYILWNEEMGNNLMKTHYIQYYDLYQNVKYPIMKIDILRYCILDKYGGMYADIDYKCLNNFDDYLSDNQQYEIFLNEQPNELYSIIFGKTTSNSLLISSSSDNPFWKIVIDMCFDRIRTYHLSYYIYYVMKTTGPGLINDIISNLHSKNSDLYQKIKILPYNQFNYCNDCNVCNPSSTHKLYAVHDYASYWNSNFWLNVRKIFSCASLNSILIVITIIAIMYILYLFARKNF